jgi:hypothetical protein
MASRHRPALAFLIALAGAGCYKPSIQDGGLRCADGGVCPEGFHCAADGTCKKGLPTTCQPTSPHIAPICSPDLGTDCDPICQSRCDCGRCTLVGTTPTCVPPGNKKTGEFCNVDADDCEPGDVCLKECDGTFGRCYRFCGKGSVKHDDLCNGQTCSVAVSDFASGAATDYVVCSLPDKTCNPIGDNGDCGNPGLGCYLNAAGVAPLCDCRGKNQPAGDCTFLNSCVPGYRCIGFNPAPATCLKTCVVAGPDGGTECASGSCTQLGGGGFGYCPP